MSFLSYPIVRQITFSAASGSYVGPLPEDARYIEVTTRNEGTQGSITINNQVITCLPNSKYTFPYMDGGGYKITDISSEGNCTIIVNYIA
jgi:hypothetical protein